MTLLPIEWRPSGRKLAVFASAWVVLLGAIGLAMWLEGRIAVAAVCWTAAGVIPLLGLLHTKALRAVFIGTSLLTLPIGWAVSWMALAVVYFLLVTPVGLILRAVGYDPLGRRFDPRAESYWTPQTADHQLESYFRQY